MIGAKGRAILCMFFLAFPRHAMAADLTIMAEDAAEPFSSSDGTGYANDVVKAAFRAAGVEIALDVVPYARCKKDTAEGKVAACFGMSWYKGVEDVITFSDLPVFQVYADVFLSRASSARISSLADIGKGSVVGIVNQYEYPLDIYALKQKGAALQLAANDNANLKMLARDRLNVAIVMTNDLVPREQKAIDAGVAAEVRFAFRAGVEKAHVGFSRKHPMGEWALEKFNAGYKQIIADGTVDAIRRKWAMKAQ